MRDRFLRRLFSFLKCSQCGRRYLPANVRVLGRQDERWFLSFYCRSCRTQALVAAVVKVRRAEEAAGPAMSENAKFASSPPVGTDDLLDIRNFLRGFDGDFSRLFSPK